MKFIIKKGMGIMRSIRKAIGQDERNIHPTWVLDLKSKILNPPKISTYINNNEEVILIGTQDGKLYQMKTSGQVMWTFSANNDLSEEELMFVDSETVNSINTIPLVVELNDKQIILFGTESGTLFCIDTTGNLLWKGETQGPIRGQPILSNFKSKEKQIIVGSSDGNLYLFSKTGNLTEIIPIESPIETSPLHAKNMIVVGTRDGEVVAINEESEIIWRFKTEDRITANIIPTLLTDEGVDVLLVASQDNNLYALNFEGETQWTFPTEGALISEVVAKDINGDNKKEIIFGSCDNKIYCVDDNGELVWSYETDFWVAATPIISETDKHGNVEIIAGSYDHKIYVLDGQGDYKLDYIPGLNGVINQTGHYSNTIHSEVGKNQGKLLCTYPLEGNIVGCAKINSGEIIANTKDGKIYNIRVN